MPALPSGPGVDGPGREDDPGGEGHRCWGFLSDDGQWAHCSREEHAGSLPFHVDSLTYAHRLAGDCRCGARHDGAPPGRPHARIVPRPSREEITAYSYRDAVDQLLFQVVRFAPKDFRQRRPRRPDDAPASLRQHGIRFDADWVWTLERLEPAPGTRCPKCTGAHRAVHAVRPVLYRLPELLAADPTEPVYVVEGEKDVDALVALGLVATTNPGGAKRGA
jgi:hypothetical protein